MSWLEALELDGAGGDRLRAQLRFILELDAAKAVLRRSYVTDEQRRENDAEHMWHVAVAAMVLAEHGNVELDRIRLVEMLLVHDIVEIDTGDTIVYDAGARANKVDHERLACQRIFGLLPGDQAERFCDLWEEFEERSTPEAKMAAAIDRLLPLLCNRVTEGRSWREHGITADRVRELNSQIDRGSHQLWSAASAIIEDAVTSGHLLEP